jgi:hypothetical protein
MAPQTSRAAIVRVLASIGLAVVAGAAAVGAQATRPSPPAGQTPDAGSWEIAGGYAFLGGYDLGSTNAELTRNTTTGGNTFVQFITDSNIERAHALAALLSYYFSPRLAVEGGFRFGKPVYRVELSSDAEGAPDEVAEDTLDQYVFSGSLVYHFPRPRSSVVPFIKAGAGYLRELHEGQELVETGMEYHAGAGIKIWFGSTRRFGLRGEGGVSFRDGGFDFEDGLRTTPIAAVSLVYLF